MNEEFMSGSLPVMALRGLVVFPNQTTHFDVGRAKSVRALEEAMRGNQILFMVPQKELPDENPGFDDLYSIGCVVRIKQILKPMDENLRVLVTGICRARVVAAKQTEPYLSAIVEAVPETDASGHVSNTALCREARMLYEDYGSVMERMPSSVFLQIEGSLDPGFIADAIAQNARFEYQDKARLLRTLNPVRRLEETIRFLRRELQILEMEDRIQERTKANIDQNQREYYLREQLKAIQSELGEDDETETLAKYEKRIRELGLENADEEKLLTDLKRLSKLPFNTMEASVLFNYLDAVLGLPWHKRTKERLDVEAARKILDRDHFGMEKVKKRILETIAVRQMAPLMPPQILCLVGPPGVGKTSIAYSVAQSLNRNMARISLGGVHDEADIRGHRKTYVGAMPGRIMAAIKQAGSRNALLLLDEVDKMGADYRGDPSAALLEVLDAEQNKTFRDHFIEVPFDLSEVMFITTANTMDTIPRPLLDRMEIIELGSYTDEEKLMIAKDHLLPKQLKKHGLKKSQLRVSEDAMREIIHCYTRESGVRNLERCLSQLCRKADMQFVAPDAPARISVNGGNLEDFLGVRKFLPDRLPCTDEVGLVTGLAWTSVGGETLEVEVNVMEGSGKLELTGNLGDVMKESAHAAVSYIRANAERLGVPREFYKNRDIHIHFPEGAVPKDGPSAGVTVTTALVSALTNTPVRRDVAMTGEVSIRGRVLPIGGLKEKTMAALRHGVRTVIIPKANERDLEEIDQTVRKALNFITAETVDTVLDAALIRKEPMMPTMYAEVPQEVKNQSRKPGIRQ